MSKFKQPVKKKVAHQDRYQKSPANKEDSPIKHTCNVKKTVQTGKSFQKANIQCETQHQQSQNLFHLNNEIIAQTVGDIIDDKNILSSFRNGISSLKDSSSDPLTFSKMDDELQQKGDLSKDVDNQNRIDYLYKNNVRFKNKIQNLLRTNEALEKINRHLSNQNENDLLILIQNIEEVKQKIYELLLKLESQNIGHIDKAKSLKCFIPLLDEIPEKLKEILISYKDVLINHKPIYSKIIPRQPNDPHTTLLVNTCHPSKSHSIKVLCRLKPDSSNCLDVTSNNTIYLPPFRHFTNGVGFQINKILCANTNQEELFEEVAPVLESCFCGCNVCVLTYGQSGSGKTYTMLGTEENPGLVHRSMEELKRLAFLNSSTSFKFYLSILEVYNEAIYDLLSTSEQARVGDPKCRVFLQDNGQSVQIKNVSEAEINNETELEYYLTRSQRQRTSSVTLKNSCSSRSHYIVMLRIKGRSNNFPQGNVRGVLMLCDLAGSENCSNLDFKGRSESKYINRSITMLTSVFEALFKNLPVVPYRDSKLTHLLKPSLMGNAKCVFIATLCTNKDNILDTYRTLNVAKKVEMITFNNKTETPFHQ